MNESVSDIAKKLGVVELSFKVLFTCLYLQNLLMLFKII